MLVDFFNIDILKKEDRGFGCNSRCQLLSSDYGVEYFGKMSCFQRGFDFNILGGGLHPPGALIF